MGKIVPGKEYTRAEIQELVDQATAKELQLQGYALRHDVLRETYTVVHWTQAGGNIGVFGKGRKPRVAFEPAAFDEKDLPPIVRRTPQERLDSMMVRILQGARAEGQTYLPDSVVAEVLGQAWKEGRVEITAEVVRQVAAHFLQQAERISGTSRAPEISD